MSNEETKKLIQEFLNLSLSKGDKSDEQVWEDACNKVSLKKEEEEKLIFQLIDDKILEEEELIKSYLEKRTGLSKKYSFI
jgi:hypothetical protein